MLFTLTGDSNNPNPTTTDSSTYSAARGAREVNGNWQDGRNFELPFPAALAQLQVLEFALRPMKICDCRYQFSFHTGAAISSPSLHFQRSLLASLLLSCPSSEVPAYSSASTLQSFPLSLSLLPSSYHSPALHPSNSMSAQKPVSQQLAKRQKYRHRDRCASAGPRVLGTTLQRLSLFSSAMHTVAASR